MNLIPENVFLAKLADAIEHREGYHVTRRFPTVAQRLNNPGCLTHWKKKRPVGESYPEENGFVVFPDYATGRRALMVQERINIFKRQLTWREFFGGRPGLYKGFCPREDRRDFVPGEAKNDPVDYARKVMEFVCVPLGIAIHTPGEPQMTGTLYSTIDTKMFTLIAPQPQEATGRAFHRKAA
jgi:hypothetical protein